MKRQYLVTERAHYMCPNMHFGMLLEVEKIFEEKRVQDTLHRMAEAHPFLKARIAKEEDSEQLYYKIFADSQIELSIRENDETLWDDYKAISKQDWNVFEHGLLKVYIYPKEQGMKVLFVQHHLLVDGKGALGIAEEFANDYVSDIRPVYVEEQLLQQIEELPKKSSLTGISKFVVNKANAQWKKENHRVGYEVYRNFVKDYSITHPVSHKIYEVTHEQVAKMQKTCHENQITMNDLLMAHMYQETKTENIIIAADIRKLLPEYQKGSLGNYATAMGIVCKSKEEDTIQLAKKVHKLVQKHMAQNSKQMLVLACYFALNPTLLDAAAISALGGFESGAGKFVGEGMFHMEKAKGYSITNLGKIENENIKSVMFIPPASPAAKLTLGVVTINGEMKICSSENV